MRGLAVLLLIPVVAAARGTVTGAPAKLLPAFGRVTEQRLVQANAQPGQWFTSGRDAGLTYYSPLSQIRSSNVGKLGFAWQYELGTSRGLEATPVVIDGVMFAVGIYGRVYALNAATGAQLWTFTPKVDMRYAQYACCDVVNRGLAVWHGRVYVGALDGYLYSLDARTGKVLWKADTFITRKRGIQYSMTGAPVVTRKAVVIGNSGADFPGVRGYVSAFDLKTGKLKWRFFTVPRNSALGPERHAYLKLAAKTWHTKEPIGGGTVWGGLIYDARTNLVYMATGNVSPYNRGDGNQSGDELFGCSVVAVNADTGKLAWYYQEVPGDRWDFDSDAPLMLASLRIDGKRRQVLMHAPKDGFFYVFDPKTGDVLAANNFVFVNWTKGLDPRTHHPIPNPAVDYDRHPVVIWPSTYGAHNWQPMSFDPETGLVYIPAIEMPNVFINIASKPAKYADDWFATEGFLPSQYQPNTSASVHLFGKLPSLKTLARQYKGPLEPRGELIAWDPVHEKAVWRAPGATFWDGGVMSTGGGLVVRGDARGMLDVYAAATGKLLRSINIGTSIMAAPMTYTVHGVQYIAFMAGYGGSYGFEYDPITAAYRYGNAGRIVALKLGGGPVPIPARVHRGPLPRPPALPGPRQQVLLGEKLFNNICSRCHVFGPGMVPDLRRMPAGIYHLFPDIVLKGLLMPEGMGNFSGELTPKGAKAIRSYLMSEAWKAYKGKRTTEGGHAH